MPNNICCTNCAAEMSKKAQTCPLCGHPNKQANYLPGWFVLLSLTAVFVVIWQLSGGGVDFSKNETSVPKPTLSSTLPSKSVKAVTATDEALGLCLILKGSGLTTHCDITASIPSVDVTIDTNGKEARKMCLGISDMLAKDKSQFDGKWELRIFSPYSGDKPIAICQLK